jgi:HlyD family secretion protein
VTQNAVDGPAGGSTRSQQPARTLSPEALDGVIVTTTPRLWWALAAIVGALVLAGMWAFLARIPQQVTATGIVSMLSYGVDVPAPASGVVTHDVVLGTEVTKGETIGQITSLDGGSVVAVHAPATGILASVNVSNGEGVTAGGPLGRIVTKPDATRGVAIVTYVSAADAITFNPGATVSISAQNLSSTSVLDRDAVVSTVSTVPATPVTLTLEAGSGSLAEQWKTSSGGVAYRVGVTFTSTQTIPDDEALQPGEVVMITNTYAEPHPIDLLFGS